MGADLYIDKLNGDENKGGYFRDSYNYFNCLWPLGLSWWADVSGKLVDGKHKMSVENAKKLQGLVKDAKPQYDSFLEKEELKEAPKEEQLKRIQWWKAHRDELIRFLQRAIDLGSPITCSL